MGMFLFSSPTLLSPSPRSPGNKALHRNSGCPKSRWDILLLVLWELHRVTRSSSRTCRQGALRSRLPPGRRLQAGGVDSPISHAGWHPGRRSRCGRCGCGRL